MSEPTVYTAYGSKVGLTAAVLDQGDPTEEVELMLGRLRAARGPADQLVAFGGALVGTRGAGGTAPSSGC